MHHVMTRLAQAMAILGGLVLSFLILMTCVSIAGRELNAALHSDVVMQLAPEASQWLLSLGIGPVLGDFELIENGMPLVIFAFLPLCQLQAAHATVDVFTSRFPPRLLRWMRAATEIVFAAVLILFAFKLYEGMLGKMRFGETTYLLQFKIWWAYALAFAASVIAAIVGAYTAYLRVVEAAQARSIIVSSEAEH